MHLNFHQPLLKANVEGAFTRKGTFSSLGSGVGGMFCYCAWVNFKKTKTRGKANEERERNSAGEKSYKEEK